MIEDLEFELTGALKETSSTENSAMAEEENVDEVITAESKAINDMEIDIKDKQNTKAYEDTMNTDIENTNKLEKRNLLYTKEWSTIYEVIKPYL